MKKIESYTCNTYRKCCWTGFEHTGPDDFGNMTCTQGHGGVSVGAAVQELSDPSSHRFCELISGTKGGATPIFAVCKGMSKAGVFTDDLGHVRTLEQCQANFCDDGKEGYERFVTNTFGWLRENFEIVFVIMLIFAVGESTLMVVSVSIILISHQAASSAQKKYKARHPEYRGKSTVQLKGVASPRGDDDTQVVGTVDPDGEWAAQKVQSSFRASQPGDAFEVEGSFGNVNNPTYSDADSNGYYKTGTPPPPPSESDWGALPPPSESDWGGGPPSLPPPGTNGNANDKHFLWERRDNGEFPLKKNDDCPLNNGRFLLQLEATGRSFQRTTAHRTS